LSNGTAVTAVTAVDVNKDEERMLKATVGEHVIVIAFAIIDVIITITVWYRNGRNGISVIVRNFACYDYFNDCRQMAFLLFDFLNLTST